MDLLDQKDICDFFMRHDDMGGGVMAGISVAIAESTFEKDRSTAAQALLGAVQLVGGNVLSALAKNPSVSIREADAKLLGQLCKLLAKALEPETVH